MKNLYLKILVSFASIPVGIVLGLLIKKGLPPAPPSPVISIDDPSQTIKAQGGKGTIHATFRIRNRGNRVVDLGNASTTCGCTVASLNPKSIRPGEEATVLVEGIPPPNGKKTVQVQIDTNVADYKHLVLSLTMIGSAPLPYVVASSGPVRFGSVKSHESTQGIWIETVEEKGPSMAIDGVVSNLTGLDVRGGVDHEEEESEGAIRRRYIFHATVTPPSEPGDYRSEIYFINRSDHYRHIFTLPVSVEVPAPVSSVPSALLLSFEQSERLMPIMFSLITTDENFDLEAKLLSNPSVDCLTVRLVSRRRGKLEFEVTPAVNASGSLVSSLNFQTNHPLKPTLKIPVRFMMISDSKK